MSRRPRRWFKLEVKDGVYSEIPAWSSRTQFDLAVQATVATAGWRADRAASFAAVAGMLAEVADAPTGRSVMLSAATIQRRLGLSRSTVFRRLADMGVHGLIYTVDRGEHLPAAVRDAARQETGRFVSRKTSTRALSIPSRMAAELATDTPPTPSGVGRTPHPSPTHQARKRAEKAAPVSTTDTKPRSLRLQRLVAKLDRQNPWMLGGSHPGALADALVKAGADEDWSARDIVDSIDAWHAAQGRSNAGRAARNPLGWLVWALRQAIEAGAKPRKERLVDEATARIAREAARVVATEQAERERVAPETAAGILAGARAALVASRAAREAAREAERERAGTLESLHADMLERKRADALAHVLAA